MPDDVLDEILSHSSLEVINLWLCGDRNFCTKITRSCHTIATDPSLSSSRLIKWPPLLSQFKALTCLSIQLNSTKDTIQTIVEHISKLSPSLVELSLRFHQASRVFLTRPAHLLENADWMTLTFPNLKKAMFCNKTYNISPTISPGGYAPDFQSLPRSLTSLRLDRTWMSRPSALSLPPGLIDLFGPVFGVQADISCLPATIQNSDCLDSFRTPVHPSWDDCFPKGLLWIDTEWNPRAGAAFPDGRPWTAFLPKTLTRVSVNDFSPMKHLDILYLPQSVAQLSLALENRDSAQTEAFEKESKIPWPSSLHTLEITGYTSETLKLDWLPPGVTSFTFPVYLFGFDATFLPNLVASGLRTLKITNPTACASTWHLSEPLPFALTQLDLEVAFPLHNLGFLPRGLRKLFLYDTHVKDEKDVGQLSAMPQLLEELALLSIPCSALPRLPPGLRTLYTSNLSMIHPETLDNIGPRLDTIVLHAILPPEGPLPPWLSKRLVVQTTRLNKVSLP